ncbi:MAG: succinylglutamate desuccinylase [Saprospiraceae bacterium]|jgi:succinylglutamate desuccinylase
MERIIDSYTEGKYGPLLIVLGAMHGNESAGVEAIKQVFKLIYDEPKNNPDFHFSGKMIGIIGNLKAYIKGVRFIDKDINRSLLDNHVEWIFETPEEMLDAEDQEIKSILTLIQEQIKLYNPSKLYILDIHTTSAQGGIFSIPSDDYESIQIALDIHAPVVQGMLDGIRGTTLHFFNAENMGIETTAVTFEAGEHYDLVSITNATSALINCLRAIGCVEHKNIEEKHNNWLYQMSKDLPTKTRLIFRQDVKPEDNFQMMPNFKNFQLVEAGTLLAKNKNGEIRAKETARVLMPLYQPQGEDGFFLVKDLLD